MYLQKVPNEEKNFFFLNLFFVGVLKVNDEIVGFGSESGSISQRHGSADPDPHQNVTYPHSATLPYPITRVTRYPSSLSLITMSYFRIGRRSSSWTRQTATAAGGGPIMSLFPRLQYRRRRLWRPLTTVLLVKRQRIPHRVEHHVQERLPTPTVCSMQKREN